MCVGLHSKPWVVGWTSLSYTKSKGWAEGFPLRSSPPPRELWVCDGASALSQILALVFVSASRWRGRSLGGGSFLRTGSQDWAGTSLTPGVISSEGRRSLAVTGTVSQRTHPGRRCGGAAETTPVYSFDTIVLAVE